MLARRRGLVAVAWIAGLALAQIAAALIVRGLHGEGRLLREFGVRYVARFAVAYYDVLTIVGLAVLFAGLAMLAGHVRRGAGLVAFGYTVVSVVALWLQLANVRADELLGGPVTYQWLYYADFLQSFTSQNALASTARPDFLWLYAAVPAAALAFAAGFRWVAARVPWGRLPTRVLALTGSACFVVYAGLVPLVLPGKLDGKLVNPLYVVARTGLVDGSAGLLSVPTRTGPEDFRGDPALLSPRIASFEAVDPAAIRNVVLVVLESVGDAYVHRPIGDRYAMPLLLERARRGVTLTDVYAVAPMTQKTLFSLVTGQYPRHSYRSDTDTYAGHAFDTLPVELKRGGAFRTGFFISADFRYQNGDDFLADRGFDVMKDIVTVECDERTAGLDNPEWTLLRAVRDRCTFAALERWIADGSDDRFFGVLWTDNTHYDYDAFAGDAPFGVDDPSLNAYANALSDADRDLDRFFRFLEDRGLDDETLVIVIGDHGEAFGQHGTRVHGESIHEEEVRIPFLMFHPALPAGLTASVIGSMVDIPPTVLDLLGLPIPERWQGRSLVREGRTGRAYLFVPSRDFIVGYREGDRKAMLDLATDRFSLYDLRSDPGETKDIAADYPEMKAEVLDRLAAWAQYQEMVSAGYPRRGETAGR